MTNAKATNMNDWADDTYAIVMVRLALSEGNITKAGHWLEKVETPELQEYLASLIPTVQ